MTTVVALVLAALACGLVVRVVLKALLPDARKRVAEWLPNKKATRLDALMVELAYWGFARWVLFAILVLLVYVFAFTCFQGLLEMVWA